MCFGPISHKQTKQIKQTNWLLKLATAGCLFFPSLWQTINSHQPPSGEEDEDKADGDGDDGGERKRASAV